LFILVINQLDAQNVFYNVFLFRASTCFEQHVLIVRRSKLYYTASGIITPTGVMIPEALHVSSTMCSSSGGQNCIIQPLVSSHFIGVMMASSHLIGVMMALETCRDMK